VHVETVGGEGDTSIWGLRPEVHWRAWDGAAVVYSDATGNTHYLADVAAWILEQLGKRPMTAAELQTAAAEALELPPEQGVADSLHASLGVLQDLKLLAAS